jgi:superfamily II DNA/RNA helicase
LLPVIATIYVPEDSVNEDLSPENLGPDNESVNKKSPSLQVDERGCMPKAIILAPTRELACQIHTESKKLCHGSNLKTIVVYGGSDIRSQLFELSTGIPCFVYVYMT